MSGPSWLRPVSLVQACAAMQQGYTPVGGGVALASASFPFAIGQQALDLSGLGLRTREGALCGAQLTLEDALQDNAFRQKWPAAWEAITATGTPEVRRLATFGGTVGAALPTSDLLTALCAHDAELECADPTGSRSRMSLLAYLADPPVALVLGIDLGPPRRGCFRRFAGRVGFAPAVASVAAVGYADGIHLWAGAVAAIPLRLAHADLPDESALRHDEQYSAWFRRRIVASLRDEALAALPARQALTN
jgi:CO/xanthine dehydrogenase FAD-binding subunit